MSGEEQLQQFIHPQQFGLFRAVDYAISSGVPGDFVEFGCYLGDSASWLAHALSVVEVNLKWNEEHHGIAQRRLWVFDSFEGFPEASYPTDLASPHIKARVWYAGEPAGGSPDGVRKKCAAFIGTERVSVVAGWFKDTLCQIPKGNKFAVVHVDCDYYESTKQVLDHLFSNDMLSDGATILFDDWYCNRGSRDYGEQKAWADCTAGYGVRFSDWGSYGVLGRRFIVHEKRAA